VNAVSVEALAISRRRLSASAARNCCSRACTGRARTLGVSPPWFHLQCLVRASFLDAQHARIDAILTTGERDRRGEGHRDLVGDGRLLHLPSRVDGIRCTVQGQGHPGR
jgi:hypothetical protein